MKIIYRYLIAYILLLLLNAVGVFSFSWYTLLWIFVGMILLLLGTIGYGFAKQNQERKKTRRFWREFYNEQDDLSIYSDDLGAQKEDL